MKYALIMELKLSVDRERLDILIGVVKEYYPSFSYRYSKIEDREYFDIILNVDSLSSIYTIGYLTAKYKQ